MKPHKELFNGCEIEISDKAILTINNKPIEYEFDSPTNKWSTRYLPYSQYDDLQALAKAVVANTVEFSTATE